MKRALRITFPFLFLALVASSSLQAAQGPFIELAAEVQADNWDWYFFKDTPGIPPIGKSSIFQELYVSRCVFGRETWMMETEGSNYIVAYWFTGTNIIEHLTEKEKGALPAGYPKTRNFDSVDGNPGRPERVQDVLGLGPKFFWLAFCSAPTLKRVQHKIYPPYDFWKEYSNVGRDWLEKADIFNDSLGLPNSIKLSVANEQPLFQYQVHQTTNLLGWNVPLEFYGVQYKPSGTNVWKTELTYKGRVTSIKPGKEPALSKLKD
jgi:hypothetical protein